MRIPKKRTRRRRSLEAMPLSKLQQDAKEKGTWFTSSGSSSHNSFLFKFDGDSLSELAFG